MKNNLVLLAAVSLLMGACKHTVQMPSASLPEVPEYEKVSCCRTFKLDGSDTIWGESEYYEYDSRGRFLSVTTLNAGRTMNRLVTFAYCGCTDTMRIYDGNRRLLRTFIHTYTDSSFLPEPPFEGPFYQHVVRSECYDPSGTLITLTNNTFDDHLRITQTDGFDVSEGILYSANLYYDFGSDYTIVHNPKSKNETMQQGSRTYADPLCRYPVSHLRQLPRGTYEERYAYDSLGRRISYVGNYAGVTVDSIEYLYLSDHIHEIDYENSSHTVRYYCR